MEPVNKSSNKDLLNEIVAETLDYYFLSKMTISCVVFEPNTFDNLTRSAVQRWHVTQPLYGDRAETWYMTE